MRKLSDKKLKQYWQIMMELNIFTKIIYTTVQKELQKYFVSILSKKL